MKRLVVTLVAVLALAGAVLGGVVLDRTVLDDDETPAITDVEHDRLIDACNRFDDYSQPAGCTAWIAAMVEWAEGEGMTYAELAEVVQQDLEESE